MKEKNMNFLKYYKLSVLIIAFVSVLVILIIYFGIVRPGKLSNIRNEQATQKAEMLEAIKNIDKIVVYRSDRYDARIEYAGKEVQEILESIQKSNADDGVYDTPVGLYKADFYKNGQKVVIMNECSGLFTLFGKQYRSDRVTLEKYIDIAIEEKIKSYVPS